MTKPIARDSIYRGRRFDADIIEDGPRELSVDDGS